MPPFLSDAPFPQPSRARSTRLIRRVGVLALLSGLALWGLVPAASQAAVLPGRKPTPPALANSSPLPTAKPAYDAPTPAMAAPLMPAAAVGATAMLLQFGLYQREGEAWLDWESLKRKAPALVANMAPTVALIDPLRPNAGYALRAEVTAGADGLALCRRIIGIGYSCLAVEGRQGATTMAAAAPPAEPAAAVPPPPPPAVTPAVTPAAIPAVQPAAAVSPPPAAAALPPPAVMAASAPAVIAKAIVESTIATPAERADKKPPPLPSAPSAADIAAASPPSDTMQAAAAALAKVVPHAAEPVVQADGVVQYSADEARVLNEIERRSRRTGRLGGVLPDTRLNVTHAVLDREKWNLCALTFDDGPHRTVTRQILDILKEENIIATYFPVAKVAAKYPDVIRDFVAAGHEVGNHSLTHADLRALPPAAQRFEIAEANRILRTMGADPVLFRPPYGRYTSDMLAITREENMSPVLWNVDTRDWQVRDPDKIVHHVKTEAGMGSVLLLHSTYASTAAALPRVIAELRAKGCQFVTLSEWITSMKSLANPMMVNAPMTTARQ